MIYRAKRYLFEYSTKWSLHYLERPQSAGGLTRSHFNISFLPEYLPDCRDRQASQIHQYPKLQGKLAHLVGRLGDVIAQSDLA